MGSFKAFGIAGALGQQSPTRVGAFLAWKRGHPVLGRQLAGGTIPVDDDALGELDAQGEVDGVMVEDLGLEGDGLFGGQIRLVDG